MYHLAADMLRERRPRAADVWDGREGGRARVPGLPGVALEEAQDQQPAGAHQQGDQAQVARGAGVPVRAVAREAGRRRDVRAGRGVVRLANFSEGKMAELYEEPGRPQPPTEEQREEYDRMARRAMRQVWSLRTGWRRRKLGARISDLGRPLARPGTRPGTRSRIGYTSFLDTTAIRTS